MAEEQQPSAEASAATSAPVPEAPTKADIATKEREERRKLPPGQRVYRRVDLPTPEMMQQEEFMNNCATRTALSAVMGSALGVVFGIFMGTMESSHIDGTLSAEVEKRSTRQVVKEMAKSTAARSVSYAKGFGAMGALFAGSECVIEKMRARHDMYNSIYAGCTTGAILAHSGGPKAMCLGCASFAAFSALIDRFMGH